MSELPVNQHLEGILSDFEALKRSFDLEEENISLSPPVPPPLSSSLHFLHSPNPAAEDGGNPPRSFTFTNSHRLGSASFPHTVLSSSPSPVIKSRSMVSSSSFNRGSGNKPEFHSNGSSVGRASSFHCRFQPNSWASLSGPGSDEDSLHSSTSSLEYSGLGGFSLHPKSSSYHCPSPQGENPQQHKSRPNGSASPGQPNQARAGGNPGGKGPNGLDLVGLQVVGNGDRFSPGFTAAHANANWNGSFSNISTSGKESYRGQSSVPRTKEAPRLNKFPLDLDCLVNNICSPAKAEDVSRSPKPPKALSRSSGGLQLLADPLSSAASPSASLSSLDSSSDPLYSHKSPCSPASNGSNNRSFSPAQTFHLDILPGPQVAQLSPNVPDPSIVPHVPSPPSASNPRAAGPLDDGEDGGRDTVDLILQRIASFSWPTSPGGVKPAPTGPGGAAGERADVAALTGPEAALITDTECKDEAAEECQGDTPMEDLQEKEQRMDGDEQTFTEAQQIIPSSTDQTELQEKLTGSEQERRRKQLEMRLHVDLVGGVELFGYVGIEAVLDQMRTKTMKTGFEFNIMVVGQSGLGKSTLVNTLFKSKISRKSCTPDFEEKIHKTVKLHSVSHVIEEKGVKMKLTVVDTPGFGDQINNDNCWEPIVKYINEQYEKFLREELNVHRKRRIPDSRVHCCIYFLPATGHRLRPIDVEFMTRLGKIVSIVPVIAKADTLTVEERLEFKAQIRNDLDTNRICVYPQKEFDQDPEERIRNDQIRENIPFAVVGTDKEHQVNGNKVLGRKTKWGIIEVENVTHCEFANLRDLLIRSHLQDLKDVTHNILYENYRVRRLNESNITFSELELLSWPVEQGAEKGQL